LMIDTQAAAYWVVQNLEIEAPGPWSGIFIQNTHHIAINDNIVHDSGNGGIHTSHADYLIINHNACYSNARVTTNDHYGSGISTYENTDIDTNDGIKNIIDGNLVFGNTNVPTAGFHEGRDSDGSGIILDDLRHSQSDNVSYKGKTWVANNIVFDNGGRGISVFYSDHATVVNNSVYHNNQDPFESSWRPGEIMALYSGDVAIYNNIAVSDGAAGSTATGSHVGLSIESCDGDVAIGYNLLFNDNSDRTLQTYLGSGEHNYTGVVNFMNNNIWGDPLFLKASMDVSVVDFHLAPHSPARAVGTGDFLPRRDFARAERSMCGAVNLGAYK
jgi:parallel beta-helix repeat protein